MTDETLAAALYDETTSPAEPQESAPPPPGSDADIAQQLYNQPDDLPPIPPTERERLTSNIQTRLKLSNRDTGQLVNLLFANREANDRQREDWHREATKEIRNLQFTKYDLEGAQQLVQRDPELSSMLSSTGLGSHPRVVRLLIEQARRERVAGRL
jgi:hypothetical protein